VHSETPGSDNRVLRVCRLLNRARAKYLLVGGVAANLHGSVRATKDVDVLVPRELANTERLLRALSHLPYRIAAELDASDVVRKPFTIVGDDPRVDILTVAATLTFEQAWPNRLERRIEHVRVPYVSLDDLLKSKHTGRPSDLADIDALRRLRR
jgi:hypothetical protein